MLKKEKSGLFKFILSYGSVKAPGFPLLLLSFLLFDSLPAQIWTISKVEKQPTGVLVHLQKGALQIGVCGDRTFHVIYSPDGTFPDKPVGFAVLHEPAPGAFTTTEDANALTITTANCQVRVDRNSGALSFLDSQGRPYLAEVGDGERSLVPAHVAGIDTYQVVQKFVLDPAEGIFGLGQHPSAVMNYVGSTVHLEQKNTDVAIPVLVSSKGYGVFWNNPAITDVTISAASQPNPTVEWKSECGRRIDYYIFYGPSLDQVISDYRELTGAAPMFGRWAWGFWQCKEHYASQQELLDVAARYRQMQVPIDNIIQDWAYWNPYPWGSHRFDEKRYPDPKALTDRLHQQDIHIIISVWARFEPGSANYQALQHAGFLYAPTLKVGNAKFYDPFQADARKLYWQELSTQIFADGFDGWWLDASEPELNGGQPSEPDWGEFRNYQTGAGVGALVYNAYPLMHSTGVYEGQRAENSDKRVFILTRSAYAGQQRNAAVTWSGDVYGNWDVFAKQVPESLNFSFSGIPYWSSDTGGFFGNDPQDSGYAELFTRWFQFSTFCPMFRVHGTNQPKEMWRFPAATEKILIDYDRLRYHLLPYIYSVAWKVTHENYTMMRGLVMDFPQDTKVLNIPDQYLFGPALMVCPVTKPITSPTFEIPSSQWIDRESKTGALTGTYFQGTNFQEKKLSRRDATLSFNWDAQSPDPQVPRTNFSARWEGSLQTQDAGEYIFQMSADDGMRLWINGQLVIDDWNAHPLTVKTAKVTLPANSQVQVKIEYFQATEHASVDLRWTPPGQAITNPTRDVYLPAASGWIDFWTGENVPGGQTLHAPAAIDRLPLYVRAGAIIPYGPDVQNAMLPEDPIELRVYRGADGSFTLYEDENDNYDYEKGIYATIPFTWDDKQQVLTIGARQGQFPGMEVNRTFRVVWVSPGHGAGIETTDKADVEVPYSGAEVRVPFHG